MIKNSKHIIATFLAVMVLTSTFSFTVKKHYCGRILVDVSIFSEAKDCGMNMTTFSDHLTTKVTKKSCCKDIITVIEGQDQLKDTAVCDSMFGNDYVVQETIGFQIIEHSNTFQNTVYMPYVPPDLVVDDIQALLQVFLI